MTRPKSPNFTKTSTKTLERGYLNEVQPEPVMDKFKAALLKSMANQEDKAAANPSSTKAMNLAMQKRREEIEAKRRQEEERKKSDKDRFDKQNRVRLIFIYLNMIIDKNSSASSSRPSFEERQRGKTEEA